MILDERGQSMTTAALANWLADQRDRATRSVEFQIGDAHGFSQSDRDGADLVLALSGGEPHEGDAATVGELDLLAELGSLRRDQGRDAATPQGGGDAHRLGARVLVVHRDEHRDRGLAVGDQPLVLNVPGLAPITISPPR